MFSFVLFCPYYEHTSYKDGMYQGLGAYREKRDPTTNGIPNSVFLTSFSLFYNKNIKLRCLQIDWQLEKSEVDTMMLI